MLQTKREGGESLVEAVLQAHQTPTQREMVRHMQPKAITAWWIPGHIGWAIFPMDSDAFLQVSEVNHDECILMHANAQADGLCEAVSTVQAMRLQIM